MTILWVAVLTVGIAVAALASRRAVVAALAVSEGMGISPGLVGVTVMAVGTDLPEIANSLAAALTGHGDVNVGDSAGSTLTQVTLILGILCVIARPIPTDRRMVVPVGAATVAAMLLTAILLADERFGQLDGLVLVAIWAISMVALGYQDSPVESSSRDRRPVARSVVVVLAWLAVVAVAATAVVQAFIRLTDALGVPELIASSVVLALGTSLPELIVDFTALRRGVAALAIGDLFGSSLVDATLSIGIGPMFRATTVSSGASSVCLVVAVGVMLATIIAARRKNHGLQSAAALMLTYVGAFTALVFVTSI